MEEASAAVAGAPLKDAPLVESPFGESPFGELIGLWLDEGERLSASAAAAPAPNPGSESRFRQVLQHLRPVIERHRLFVLVGLGLLPLALILCLHRGAPAQAAASMIAAPPPVAAPPSAQSAAPSSARAQAPSAPVALARAGSADVKAPPSRHHHHHRRHAKHAPSKSVASAGRATRR
jgi:hypothetical protein